MCSEILKDAAALVLSPKRSSLSEASTRSVSGLLGKMKESLAEHGLFPSRHSAYRGKAAALHQSLYLIKGSLSTGGAAALAWN